MSEINLYNELTDSVKKLNKPINEQLRQVQINTYYYKRHKSENQILYFIMIVFVIIIFIAVIKKSFPFFDDYAYSIIVGTIFAFSILYVVYSIYLLMYKDDHNYDEDNYKFNSTIPISDNSNINYDCLKRDPKPN
jgi:hypothetical protein